MSGLRIGVASIVQETNTFSPQLSSIEDFESQGIDEGEDIRRLIGRTRRRGVPLSVSPRAAPSRFRSFAPGRCPRGA
jgi:microcystin degradation protein MlrC